MKELESGDARDQLLRFQYHTEICTDKVTRMRASTITGLMMRFELN